MKKTILTSSMLFALTMSVTVQAQDTEKKVNGGGFVFMTVKENPITSVKNQNHTDTCWCYSSCSFLESELLRMERGGHDLSEIFTVYNTCLDHADAAVRTHGDVSFSQGGSFYDALYGMETFGLVPEGEIRPGMMYADTLSDYIESSALTNAMVAAIARGKLHKLRSDENNVMLRKKAAAVVHRIYSGVPPEKFTYEGKEYTPKSFLESMSLKALDYVSLTPYTHHPFYTQFPLEIQDNWRRGMSHNLPLSEFMEVFDNAINTGYAVAWGSGVSESGFTHDGVAVMPDDEKVQELNGSDMAHWLKLKPGEKKLSTKPQLQEQCTQAERQLAYDNYETTGNHGVQIYGIAKDQEEDEYYMIKNFWRTNSRYSGIWYTFKAFVRYKTMNIVAHRGALPKAIKARLDIK